MLTQLYECVARNENGLAVGLLNFHELSHWIELASLEQRFYPFQNRVAIYDLSILFVTVNVVALCNINGLARRLTRCCSCYLGPFCFLSRRLPVRNKDF